MKAVLFDVDSTLVTIEGLDYLAHEKGLGPQIEAITKQGMDGQLDFNQSLTRRLNILKPRQFELQELGTAYCHHLTPGARDIVVRLSQQYDLWLISGGINPSVNYLAQFLDIPHVAANNLYFTKHGTFSSLNNKNPLAHAGGKAKVVERLRKKYDYLAFIGDGATDLEVQPLVNRFIGFGGVVYREKVAREAEIYVRHKNLTAILSYLL